MRAAHLVALAKPKRSQMFTLEQVVPWGRSFDEYCRMFALGDDHLALRILGCGEVPVSRGLMCVSVHFAAAPR